MVNSYMTFLPMSVLNQHIDNWMGAGKDDLVFSFEVKIRAAYLSSHSELSFIEDGVQASKRTIHLIEHCLDGFLLFSKCLSIWQFS
jgi:hypothetical protein